MLTRRESSHITLPHTSTFANQDALPKFPIPPLEDTYKRYLIALRGLQDDEVHAATTLAVQKSLEGDGPALQERLKQWAAGRASYIEDFWRVRELLIAYRSVVLALNPFFVLKNDPTPDRGSQLPRAAALVISSLSFIHDLRAGLLNPDAVRGRPLDMDRYTSRGQFYWFDVLDDENRPLSTEREVLRNLQAVVHDAGKTPITEVACTAIGVLTTENRKTWSQLRQALSEDRTNAACLRLIDDAAPAHEAVENQRNSSGKSNGEDLAALCSNFLCGTYDLREGVQLQIIVCADGAAGVNFEHTGVDGHTVLRYVLDM
ncbi:hypothetical protein JVT61DRAFT_10711 [Boletus reticuloceps]|uniref:Choline/carnitine acyltransferase domain-containing protein n=1 Tax=Boletus reticuloceps TaxID=495285 RepID=A0A8I2YFK1_9AGAM|nr:hypothetical protein JVT61DRAFT_10711 [Boletus reticuloceps]